MQSPLCPGFLEDSPIPCFSSNPWWSFSKHLPRTSQAGRGALWPASQGSGLLSQASTAYTCFLLLQLMMAGVCSLGRVCSLLRKASPDSTSRTRSSFPGTSWHLKHVSLVYCLCLCHPLTLRGTPYLPNCRHKYSVQNTVGE